MNKRTLTALKGSIAKWTKVATDRKHDCGIDDCPLCKLFYAPADKCRGCPVSAKTGVGGCRCTPWQDWALAFPWNAVRRATTPALRKLARAELRFLQSLLPKPARKKRKVA